MFVTYNDGKNSVDLAAVIRVEASFSHGEGNFANVYLYLVDGSKININYFRCPDDLSLEEVNAMALASKQEWDKKLFEFKAKEERRQDLIACSLQVIAENQDDGNGLHRLKQLL